MIRPYEINDNGMRETKRGKIGQAQFVCHENPEHIAFVVGEKTRRAVITAHNMAVFS